MNVAVTGCTGYIGSILSQLLFEKKYNIIGCDWSPQPTSNLDIYKKFINVSFDEDVFIESILNNDVKVIFHLAATSLVAPSYSNPLEYYDNNTARTTILLNKLRLHGWIGHIIFASTAAVYGNRAKSNGFNENNILEPVNHYGRSKLFCEQILNTSDRYDIKTTSFRFFNVVGSYKDLGEEQNDSHLLSSLCEAALHDKPFYLFGNDYLTTDGTCVRDYVHVVDVCDALILAAESKPMRNDAYNLGTSRGTSVLEMVTAFKKFTGQNITVEIQKRRRGDPDILIADPKKFMCSMGFQYNHSSLQNMIQSTWEFFKKRGK
jgi:UDP-glucose 4-epimerase